MSHCGSDRTIAKLRTSTPRSKEHKMFNVRVITLTAALALAISGAALSAAPLASANGQVAAATATDDHNRGQSEPGDDNGVLAEPGDDKGLQVEPGDDKSSDIAASAATRSSKAKTSAKAKRHTHIRRASHRASR
jgi:hypothetical protein